MSRQGEERRAVLIKDAQRKIEEISKGHAFHVDQETIDILNHLILELKTASFESKTFKKLLSEKKLAAKKFETKFDILKYENKKLLEHIKVLELNERKQKAK
jgi:hypothetical protein|tara:strand:+ start:446 stop:751 length:306 start_codon:yes stop_codon:yes gene_type:complete